MSYLFCCGRAAYFFLIPGPPSLLCSDERDFLFWMQSCLEPFQKTKNKTHNRLYLWQAPEWQATKKSTSESKKSTSESLHVPWILHSCDENVCGFLSCSISTFINQQKLKNHKLWVSDVVSFPMEWKKYFPLSHALYVLTSNLQVEF